jgi:L-iditol 2-dehydrogenase
MEPFSCAIYGTDEIGIHLAETVVINGAGPIGLMRVRLAALQGARVICCDLSDERLAVAKKMAAEETVSVRNVASETTFTCCGVCDFCRRGETGMCRSGRKSLGWSANGYWAEYILVNAQFSHKLAPHVNAKGAAVLEPFTCGVKAILQRVKVYPGDWAVVWGPGPIGLGVTQMARLAGARVILVGTEHSRPRLEVAKKVGAYRTLVTGVDDIVAEVKAMTGGYGPQLCTVAAASQTSFKEAIACVRRQGNVLMLTGPFEKPLELRTFDVLENEVAIVYAEGTNPASWGVAVDLLNAGLVDLDSLVSDVFPLDRWQEGVAKTGSHEGMKVLLQP